MLSLSRQPGFTLIEAMIVITIIAILALLGAPSFVVWRANGEVRGVAEALQNDIRLAQTEAFRRNRQVALILTNGEPIADNSLFAAASPARNWAIFALPLPGVGETASFIASHFRPQGRAEITGGAICFNSLGRLTPSPPIVPAGGVQCAALATTAPTTFNITHPAGDRPLRVEVRLGGQVRMCDPGKPLSAPDAC